MLGTRYSSSFYLYHLIENYQVFHTSNWAVRKSRGRVLHCILHVTESLAIVSGRRAWFAQMLVSRLLLMLLESRYFTLPF